MKPVIISFFARFSLIVFPHSLAARIRRVRELFLSYRFAYSVKAAGKTEVQSPLYIKGYRYIKIGDNFSAAPGLRVECWDRYRKEHYIPVLEIGDNVSFNFYCHIGVINKIIIGNNVLVGSHVLITDHLHGCMDGKDRCIPPAVRSLYSKGPVVIDDDVWIGEGVAILPGVHIGKGAVIGANAVVTGDVPDYTVVAGAPARIIKRLSK